MSSIHKMDFQISWIYYKGVQSFFVFFYFRPPQAENDARPARTTLEVIKNFNPILPMLWKDVVTRGGAIMAPPLFFRLWGCQKHKTEPWHIFGTKNYLKSHFEHF